ncbi:MAG: hypothetical protein ACQETI_08570 [Halobacteriota archaeon]
MRPLTLFGIGVLVAIVAVVLELYGPQGLFVLGITLMLLSAFRAFRSEDSNSKAECPNCGLQNGPDVDQCWNCGVDI